jgi:hypothetical protein
MTQPQPPMSALALLVSGERTTKADSNARLAAAVAKFADTDALQGERGTFTPREGQPDLPPMTQHVATHVKPLVDEVAASWADYVNILASKEWGNSRPSTWVDIHDPEDREKVLIKQATPAVLLALEAHLAKWRLFLEKIPTLPATERWSEEDTDGVWRSEPILSRETAVVRESIVGYEATPEHPANVEYFSVERDVGVWETTRFSSAYPPERVRRMLERLDALVGEIRKALYLANCAEVEVRDVGDVLIEYITSDPHSSRLNSRDGRQ